jgi:hypothetical protein
VFFTKKERFEDILFSEGMAEGFEAGNRVNACGNKGSMRRSRI